MTGILGNTLYIRVHGAQTRVSPVSICTYPYIQLRVHVYLCICARVRNGARAWNGGNRPRSPRMMRNERNHKCPALCTLVWHGCGNASESWHRGKISVDRLDEGTREWKGRVWCGGEIYAVLVMGFDGVDGVDFQRRIAIFILTRSPFSNNTSLSLFLFSIIVLLFIVSFFSLPLESLNIVSRIRQRSSFRVRHFLPT